MKFVFVRHGHAVSAVSGAHHDRTRELSSKGTAQVRSIGEQFGTRFSGSLKPAAVFTSPLPRTIKTAEVLVGGVERLEHVPMFCLPSLFYHPDLAKHDKANALFERLRYRPLREYVAEPDGPLMLEIGHNAATQIRSLWDSLEKSGDVLIVGHAVALPAVIRSFMPTTELMEEALDLNLGEADCVVWHTNPGILEPISPKLKQGEGEPVRHADEHVLSRSPDGVVLKPGAPGHG